MLLIPFNHLPCNSLILPRPQSQWPQNALPVQKDPQKGPLLPAATALVPAPAVLTVEKVCLWCFNPSIDFLIYRVYLKFSDTWKELFVVNWFISKSFWGNTKWKKVSSPHYLKILMKLSKHGISYSLKRNTRSISKITFYANLRVSQLIQRFDIFSK